MSEREQYGMGAAAWALNNTNETKATITKFVEYCMRYCERTGEHPSLDYMWRVFLNTNMYRRDR